MLCGTELLGLGHEFGAAIHLNAAHQKRAGGDQLAQQGGSAASGRSTGDQSSDPFGHRIIGGDVLNRLVRCDIDEEGIDLRQLAKLNPSSRIRLRKMAILPTPMSLCI